VEHHNIARGLLAILCGCQGIATPVIDLSRTHATNPAWTGHARFHLVWQVSTVILMSLLEVALIWWPGPYEQQRFYLTVIVTGVPLLAFLIALIGRKAYDGALSDPNGIQPVRVSVFGKVVQFDLNQVVVMVALLILASILVLYAGFQG
jgi:hypothetical protein